MEKQKEIQKIKQLIRRRWKTFLVVFSSLLPLAFIIAFILPPVYLAKSTILIEAQQIPTEYVKTSVTSYVEERLSTISQEILSRARLLEIINKFNLYPDMRKNVATEEIIGIMRKDIKLETISAGDLGKGERVSGKAKGMTVAFTLSYEGKDPATVQKVTNVLASLYLEENLKKRSERAEGTAEFLSSQLAELKKQIDDYAVKISALKSAHVGELPEHSAINMQAIDQLSRDLDQINAQIRTAQERKVYLEGQLTSSGLDQPDQLDALRKELKSRQATLTDQHPDIIRLKREIRELEKGYTPGGSKNVNPAYTSLKTQIETAALEVRSLKQQSGRVQSQLNTYKAKLSRAPMIEGDYKSLLSDYENAKNKYNDIMNKLLESRVAQGMEETQQAERFTIIEPAAFPETPAKPNRPKILLAGLFLSLLGGITLVTAQESLDRSIKSEDDLITLAEVPVLSAIPFMVDDSHKKSRQVNRKPLIIITASVGAVTVILALVLTHLFLKPLDILWIQFQQKLMMF